MAPVELTFFSAALGAFLKSGAKFQVVCTAPGGSGNASPLQPAPPPSLPSPFQKLIILDSSFNPPTVAHMQMATSALVEIQKAPNSTCRLLLLLSVNNADKAPKPAAFEQRLSLMFALAKDIHHLLLAPAADKVKVASTAVSAPLSIDIGLTTQPYFHEKSKAIAAAELYSGNSKSSSNSNNDQQNPTSGIEQVFLIGYDTLIRLFDPKYYTAPTPSPITVAASSGITPMQAALSPFLQRARLRVVTRSDDQWGSEETQLDSLQRICGQGEPEANWADRIEATPGIYKGENIVSSTLARQAAKVKNWPLLSTLVGTNVHSWIRCQNLYS